MFFSDALLAIIMTILVLDIKIPVQEYTTDNALLPELLKQLPHFIGFVVSFSIIAILWISHHQLMQTIVQPDLTLARINFGLLCSTAVIPFSTAFAAEYPSSPLAACMMAINFLVMSIFMRGMFSHTYKTGLGSPDFFPAYYTNLRIRRGIVGSFVFVASALVAFISPLVSHILLVFVPILHSIPIKAPKHLR